MRTLDELGISETPWSVEDDYWYIDAADGTKVAYVVKYDCADADARLIAAAPMLYEALRGLLEIVCDDCKSWYGESREKCKGCPRVKTARAALAAASGESEERKTK